MERPAVLGGVRVEFEVVEAVVDLFLDKNRWAFHGIMECGD